MFKFLISPLVLLLTLSTGLAVAESPAADNSAVNSRDRDQQQLTPPDQSQDKADIALVATARRDVLAIDGLSVAGQNIKIITGAGRITLRGPVANVAERTAIETAVRKVSGKNVVDSQLEVE